MKWSSVLILGAIALIVNACEKHDVAQLPPEHATAFGEHAWSPKGGSQHGGAKHEEAKAPAAAPAAEGAGGEAPQYFPKTK